MKAGTRRAIRSFATGPGDILADKVTGLAGKVALVTGAASEAGLNIARALGSRGAAVILADADMHTVWREARRMRARGISATAAGCDAGSVTGIHKLVEGAWCWRDRLDIVVCVTTGRSSAPGLTPRGAACLLQRLLPRMGNRGQGRVMLVLDDGGSRVGADTDDVVLARLTQRLAAEWTEAGICVNAVSARIPARISRPEPDTQAPCGPVALQDLQPKNGGVASVVLALAGPAGHVVRGRHLRA